MKTNRVLPLFIFLFGIFGCAAGPRYYAVKPSEVIRSNYETVRQNELFYKSEELLREIYARFTALGCKFVKEGLGIMAVKDEEEKLLYYLMILVRPHDLAFDLRATSEKTRFSEIVHVYLPRYVFSIKKEDLVNFDGLTIGIYWPVRDFSVCKEYGGFIEYAHFNIPKMEVYELIDKRRTLSDVLKNSEIIISFNLESPRHVRIEFWR
ncbi:MAG: hypothetical protein NZ583_03735 [Desulfobacterota bacterium]|nr:hypothetical protein [Thermodesulfobacteriota bacterium]MDW8001997.1 hypothetical protein [Deltaproteobacteria bacterium]